MNLISRIEREWTESIIDRILDRLFWTFVLSVALILFLVVMAFDFFFESFFPEDYNRWFSADAGNAIAEYQAFRRQHPVICWCLQWPLLTVGM